MQLIAFVLGFAWLTGNGFSAPAPIHDVEQVASLDATLSSSERSEDGRAMLAALNAARADNGLRPLAFDARLYELARTHAKDMVARRYFAHATPEGLTPFARMDRLHYRYSYAGENIALDDCVDSANQALMHSSEHRANILQPHFGRVGVAAVTSTDGEIFVEDFSD